MLRLHTVRKTYSMEHKHRTFGRIHISANTKVKAVANTRDAALKLLLDTGEPVRDIVDALRAKKISIEAVTECVRTKQPFDVLRASKWPTLGDAIADLVASHEDSEQGATNTARSSTTALKQAAAFFGEARMIETITFEDVTGYKEHLKAQGLQQNTVALYVLIFGSLYTFLQKRETRRARQHKRTPAILFSPVDRKEHIPAKQKTRVRFLSEAEADRLLIASPDDFRVAVAVGLFAGLRAGEVEMLRVGVDIDLETNTIFVQSRTGWTPKYRKDRKVPISSALLPYLVAHLKRLHPDEEYLLPGRSDGAPTGRSRLFSRFRRARKDADLVPLIGPPDVTFHTLRHTFASWLVMSGADLFTVARLMGHGSTKQVEDTYAHLSPEHEKATVEMLTARWANRSAGHTRYARGDTPK